MIYLPNTRWFRGEESRNPSRRMRFAQQVRRWLVAGRGRSIVVGSWVADVSIYIARICPWPATYILQFDIIYSPAFLCPRVRSWRRSRTCT